MVENIEFVTVNYNTPDLLQKCLSSFNEFGGVEYNFRVIDGSDTIEYKQKSLDVARSFPNVSIDQLGYNIHHGPGMDYAIQTSKYKNVFIVDSDVEFKYDINNMLEIFLKNHKHITGFCNYVNRRGIDVRYKDITYVHPRFMLVNVESYLQLKMRKGIKFVKHGAPLIHVMTYIRNNKLENEWLGKIDEQYRYFYYTKDRGTCGRFGYKL